MPNVLPQPPEFPQINTQPLRPKTQGANKLGSDIWGVIGSICAAISAGFFLAGLCLAPFACLSIPISMGGVVSSIFAKSLPLKLIGICGNLLFMVLSLALAAYTVWAVNSAIDQINY